MVEQWLVKWGVPLKSARVVCAGGFSCLKGQVEVAAALRKACKSYSRTAEVTGVPLDCVGAVITGGLGSGRSTMAALALRYYAEKGLRAARYVTMDRLVSLIAEKQQRSVLAPLVLVIDDFSLNGGVGKFASSIMNILSARAAGGRPTIVTTSHNRDSMREWAEGAFASWAAGSTVYVRLESADLNRTVAQKVIKSRVLDGRK